MTEIFDWRKAKPAPPTKKHWAHLTDFLIAILIFAALIYFFRFVDIDKKMRGILTVVIPFCYYLFSDALPGGQSIGKRVFGICVISKKTGKPCNLLQSFLRNGIQPFLYSFTRKMVFDRNNQSMGDSITNTIVVEKSAG